jgi:hypothetical protein
MRSEANVQTEIRVALIEDDRRLREGMGMLVGGSPGFRLVGSYGPGGGGARQPRR